MLLRNTKNAKKKVKLNYTNIISITQNKNTFCIYQIYGPERKIILHQNPSPYYYIY